MNSPTKGMQGPSKMNKSEGILQCIRTYLGSYTTSRTQSENPIRSARLFKNELKRRRTDSPDDQTTNRDGICDPGIPLRCQPKKLPHTQQPTYYIYGPSSNKNLLTNKFQVGLPPFVTRVRTYINTHLQHLKLQVSAYGGVPPLPLNSIPLRDNKNTGSPLNKIIALKLKSAIPEAYKNHVPTHSPNRHHKTPALPPVHHTSQWESPIKGKQKDS